MAIETNLRTIIKSPSKFELKIMFAPSIGKKTNEKTKIEKEKIGVNLKAKFFYVKWNNVLLTQKLDKVSKWLKNAK